MAASRDRSTALPIDAAEAGRLYVQRGAIARPLLRGHVYRAWERSHLQKASALTMKAEALSSQATERLLENERELVETAEAYVKALSEAAGAFRHGAMLTDRHGILLRLLGDKETLHGPEPFPGPGTLLSEAVAGANGVGTTLAEGKYVELVGHEHFIRGFHPFTCQGVPIRDQNGTVLGSISTSVRTAEASQRLREILICAAHGIEAELIRKRLEKVIQKAAAAEPSEAAISQVSYELSSVVSATTKKAFEATSILPNKSEVALALLKEATLVIAKMKRHAMLWLNLAGSDIGKASSFSVTRLFEDILELLSGDVRRRGLKLRWRAKEEVSTFGYRLPLARRLLRTVLKEALDAPEELAVGIEAMRSSGPIRLSVGRFSQILPYHVEGP